MSSSAFEVYPLRVGAGQIALSPIIGRSGSYGADLAQVLAWSPALVLSMTTQAELDRTGARDLGEDLAAMGIGWHHLPVADFGAPDAEVAGRWPQVFASAEAALAQGGKVLIHCYGGCGRSGMAALRLMVQAGEAPDAALARLRAARPCAVETDAQKAWAFSGA